MTSPERLRLAWCVSGQGTLLRAVVEASLASLLETRVVHVFTDRALAIEEFVQNHGIATTRLPFSHAEGREEANAILRRELKAAEASWLGLTFNWLLDRAVIDAMGGRVFNIHLALLPAFPGFSPVTRALRAGVRIAGVTIHLANQEMDAGPVIAQAARPVYPDDTESALGRRLFEAAVPQVLQVVRAIERRELTLDGEARPVWTKPAKRDEGAAAFPAPDDDVLSFARSFCARY